jgi:DNA repair ATPase RecN
MTDYFALLDEARRPWLEPEKLKEKYFSRARTAPADAELNEAFRVLSDPKLRLHHLLTLEGADLIAGRPVPAAVADLSWKTGTLLREIERWLVRNQATATTLARALLRPEREKLEQRLGKMEEALRAAYEAELAQLPRARADWPNELAQLVERYDSIAYLTRLLEQTAEKRFQLSAAVSP